MIHDLAAEPPDELPAYDVCVVGTGPAGTTVACELAGSGLSVAVLESGRRRTTRFADDLRAVRSEGIAIKEYSRERVLGGTSTTWAGLSSPLDEIDLGPRPWLTHAAEGWPLTRDELEPWWRAAAARYRFADLPLFGAAGFAALKGEGDVVLDWQALEEKVFLAASDPQDFGAEQRAVFEGPEVDLYLDATVLRLEGGAGGDAADAGARSQVRRAVLATSGGVERALTARVFVLAAGGLETPRLLLQSTDLCPAGLGNAHDQVGRYLMNHPKNYFGVIELARPVRELAYHFGCLHKGYAGYAGLRLQPALQREQELLNAYVRFEPLFPWSDNPGVESLVLLVKRSRGLFRKWKDRRRDEVVTLRDYSETGDDSDLQNERKGPLERLWLLGRVLRHLPSVTRYVLARLRHGRAPEVRRVRLRNFLEMEPDPENRVTLGDDRDALGQPVPVVRHAASGRDRRSIVALHRALTEELERNGFGRLASNLAEDSAPWPIDQDASHHLGTTRMGRDPATSVVDPDLRVHGVDNVYVSGGSVFPTSGCANPTFTVVALAMRLADHLRREVFGRPPREAASGAADGARPRAARGSGPFPLGAPVPAPGGGDPPRRVLLIGAGGRALTDVLPAFARHAGRFELSAVFARAEREVTASDGAVYGTRALASLSADDVAGADLVYLAVSKGSVPRVLARLAEHERTHADLLVDTPVLEFRDLGHLPRLDGWRRVAVPEDCAYLPWMETVHAARELTGPLREAVFEHSAWRYHGLAMVKTLLGSARITRARRHRVGGVPRLELRLANGARATIVEPRDYGRGRFVLRGERAALSDAPRDGATLALRPVLDGDRCTGFRVGDVQTTLSPAETALVGPTTEDATVTSKMDDLKRAGLWRLLAEVHAGRGAYPLDEGLDDMAVDALVERLRVWLPTPLTSLKSPLGRRLIPGGLRLLRG